MFKFALAAVRFHFSRCLENISYSEASSHWLDPILERIPASWQDQND